MNLWEYLETSAHGTATKIQEALGVSKNYLWQKRRTQSGFTQEQAAIIRNITQGAVQEILISSKARGRKAAPKSASAAPSVSKVQTRAQPVAAAATVAVAATQHPAATQVFKQLLRQLVAAGLSAPALLEVIERLDQHLAGEPETLYPGA